MVIPRRCWRMVKAKAIIMMMRVSEWKSSRLSRISVLVQMRKKK